MKNYEIVNGFFSSTKIRLKGFIKSGFEGGATSGKYRKSIIIVLKGTQLIIH